MRALVARDLTRVRRARANAFLTLMLLVGCATSGVAADESAAPRFVCAWGQQGTGPAEFNFPIGIAINPQGEIVVTDFYNGRVQRFDSEGRHRASFAVLPNPGGLA